MTNFFKKIYVAIAGIMMAMTAQVNGADCNSLPCCEPSSCGTYSPCCGEFNIRGDLLYWTPELCGLESIFGTTIVTAATSGGVVTTTVTESDKEPDSKWSPGFRVGA